MILVIGCYDEPNEARRKEYQACAVENAARFRQVIVDPALTERLTFDRAFWIASCYAHPRELVCIANSDVTFDDSLERAERLCQKPRTLLAITRWEAEPAGDVMRVSPKESQDAWFYRMPGPNFPAPFALGLPGCDNRLVAEALHAGWSVRNPWLLVRVRHHHASGVRHYTEADRLVGPYGVPHE